MSDLDTALERAAAALAGARYAVALVGAGISVESGIPPFRGAGGLWTKRGEPPMDGYQRFIADPATAWREMLERRQGDDEFAHAIRDAAPNPAHFALARLEELGVLKHTITQNIDNLHFVAGSVAVTEIHGNRTKVRCIDCGGRWPFESGRPVADATDLPALRRRAQERHRHVRRTDPQAALAECYEQASALTACSSPARRRRSCRRVVPEHRARERRDARRGEHRADAVLGTRARLAPRTGGEALPRLADAVAALLARRDTA